MRGRNLIGVAMVALTAIALGLGACGERTPPAAARPKASSPAIAPAPPASGAARAAALEAALPSLMKVDSHREQGASRTLISGYFDKSDLKVLDETVTGQGLATIHNRYYFDGGVAFYFRGEAPAGKIGGGPGAMGSTVPLRAEFAGARVLSAVRVEHYGEVKLEPAAIEAIRRQGAELASAVISEESAPKPR